MATFNTPIHNLRPPTPSYSDQGDESCDEVDEGLYEADEQESDGEEEKGPEIEREMMHQQEEAVRKQEEQKKGKGKAKEEELDEEMVIIEPERMVDALPRSTRIDNFSSLLRKRSNSEFNRADYKLAKKAGKAGFKSLQLSFKSVATILSKSTETLILKVKRPLKVSEFPSLPPSSNLGPPPLLPAITYPAPLANLPANGLRDLVAAGGEGGGGGGGGGAIDLDASTQQTGSTETCPGGEDAQVEENAGVNILDVQELVEGNDVHDHYFSPFTPSKPHPPILLSRFDPLTGSLSTRQGLISSTTIEMYKGRNQSYRYQLSNHSLYLLHSSLPKVIASRCPVGKRYFNLINTRQSTRRYGPGHHSTNRTYYRLFAKNSRGLVLVEVKWKVKTNGEVSYRHYLWMDASVAEEESWRQSLLKEKFIEGEKRRGKPLPAGSMKNVDSWLASLSPDVKTPVQALKDSSKTINPFLTTPPSPPILKSDNIRSSSSFAPSTTLRTDIDTSAVSMPSKTVTFHRFQSPLIKEFWGNFEMNSVIRGGTVLENHDGEKIQCESVFGVGEDLQKLGMLFEEASGGLVKGKELGTVHVALPRGAASEWRKLHHKTMPYQAVLVVQDYCRDKPHLWGKALFVGMCSWTSTGVLDIAVSSVLSVHPNYDKVFIVGGNDWLPARAAFSHDKFESMGLISLEKKSTRHEKKLGKKLAEEDSDSLSGVVKKWRPMLDGGFMELNLHYSSTTYFLLPFATSLMNKHKIPVRSIKISFAKTITSTGEATLGKKLADRSNKPSKIRIYFSDNATFSCSFDNSSIIHALDRTTLNPQGPVLLGLVASVVLDEVDEGRVPGLSSTFESKQVKKMLVEAKQAYESFQGIGSSKDEVDDLIFKSSDPYKDGCYPVWYKNGTFENFDSLDKSVPLQTMKELNTIPKATLLGYPITRKSEVIPETLYYLYLRDGVKGTEIWVKGTSSNGPIDENASPLWSKKVEEGVMKAVVRCAELASGAAPSGPKRRKVG